MAVISVWETLDPDLLEMIIRKLSHSDAVNFSAVCTTWRSAMEANSVISRRQILLTVGKSQTDVITVSDDSYRLNLRLSKLADDKLSCDVNAVAVSLRAPYNDHYIVGSGKHMLVLADSKTQTNIVLIDRFSQDIFRLPPIFIINTKSQKWKAVYIPKAVAFVSPEKKNIALAAICYCSRPSLIYYRDESWSMLDNNRPFEDIVAWERQLLVLLPRGSVDVWLVDQRNSHSPMKIRSFVPWENLPVERSVVPTDYLVVSAGEFLLVRKFASKPSTTVGFEVYKSGLGRGQNWKKVDSLGEDRALFLGRNGSVSVSVWSRDLPKGCEADSIYFTDYRVRRIYSGLDMGVYSLKGETVQSFYEFNDAGDVDDPEPDWLEKTLD